MSTLCGARDRISTSYTLATITPRYIPVHFWSPYVAWLAYNYSGDQAGLKLSNPSASAS